MTCLPPAGTADNTTHELSDHIALVEFLWLDGLWHPLNKRVGNSPAKMAAYGWFYRKPVCESPQGTTTPENSDGV